VFAELLKQLWTEQHIAIFAPLAALDVNHHAFAIHVADFQTRQLGAPHSRGVERHQQGVMVGCERRINELRDFFCTQDRGQAKYLLRIGSLFDAPGLPESFGVEESESCKALSNRARCQFLFLEEFGLVFANMARSQAVRRKVESSREIFDGADVGIYGSLGVITTLEFLQHHFSKMGHRDTSL